MTRPGQPLPLRQPKIYPPIGVLPLVLWDARVGVAVSGSDVLSWTDQMRNLVVSPPSTAARPTYVVDGSNFRGRKVVTFDGVDDSLQNINFPTPLFAAGTRPHWFYVFRRRVLGGGTGQRIFVVMDEPPNVTGPIALVGWGAEPESLGHYYYPKPIELNSTTPLNLAVHFQESWIDGTGTWASRDGGTPTGVANADGVATAMQSIFMANDRALEFCPLNLAALGCYGSALTLPQRAGLRAWAQSYWGTP